MPDENHDKTQIVRLADLPRLRADHFVSVYANQIETTPTFYDIALTFARVTRGPNGKPVLEEQATATVAWEHAIRLRDLLSRLLTAYEEKNGPIRLMHESKDPEEEGRSGGGAE